MRTLGPVALLALLGTFLLPFIELSCRGKKVGTMTGYEVAFGTESKAELDLGKLFSDEANKTRGPRLEFKAEDRSNRNYYVTAALIMGVIGGVLGFIRSFLGGIGGMAAAVLLLVAQTDIQRQAQKQEVAIVAVTFREGFWISLGCAAAGGVLCLLGGRK